MNNCDKCGVKCDELFGSIKFKDWLCDKCFNEWYIEYLKREDVETL